MGNREEALDADAIHRWLKSECPRLAGDNPPTITQFSGGVSNWTYGLSWSDHRMVLRRPPAGTKARSAHNMEREFRFQKTLKPHFAPIADMIAYCPDESVIGADFYLMEWVDGLIPARRLPDDQRWDTQTTQAVSEMYVDTLVRLHTVDPTLPGIAALGKGEGYARRQIEGWNERYRAARTWNVPRGDRIMRWLAERIPNVDRLAIVHNDFRLDNMVLDPENPSHVRAVLDWELATIGDPLMDLGNSMAYWIEPGDDVFARSMRKQPSDIPGMPTRNEIVERYCDATGVSLSDWPFYEVYGLFRLSAIAQQIYYRYHHKQTSNRAFRHFWASVQYLHWRCRRIIKRAPQ